MSDEQCACCTCTGREHGDFGMCFIEHHHGCNGSHGKRVPCNRLANVSEIPTGSVDGLGPDSDVTERAARAYDPEAFEDHPIEQRRPLAAIQWGARRCLATEAAQRLAAAGLLTPAGATWHTDPPPGWSTFGAHALMDEVPALEFWGEEYGGDGLPIWERPVPAPDADVAERIARAIEDAAYDAEGAKAAIRTGEVTTGEAQAWDEAIARAADIARSHATPTFTTEQEIESLAAEILEAYTYHGIYTGGAMHGEPYSMCRINAERIIRRRSAPPVASPEIPGFEGTRSALDGLTIRKEKISD